MDPLRLKSSSSHGNLKQHHTPTQPHDAELLICLLTFYRSLKSEIKTESERFTSVLWRLSSGTSAGFGGVDQNEKWRHSKCPNSLRMLQIDYFLSLTVWGIQPLSVLYLHSASKTTTDGCFSSRLCILTGGSCSLWSATSISTQYQLIGCLCYYGCERLFLPPRGSVWDRVGENAVGFFFRLCMKMRRQSTAQFMF